MNTDPTNYLPISMLNQLEYCERRFYLMHVRGEMDVNAHVLEGALRHETAHTPSRKSEDGIVTHRRVYVWSDDLRIAGFTDLVEEVFKPQHDGQPKTERALIPVEYKKGRMGKWLNDYIQLCAQALCIAERTGAVVSKGYIFYFGSRHRQEVIFTPELRQRTVESIHRAHALAQSGSLPPPIANYNKCRDCSLEPICLPREVKILEAA